MDSCSRTGGGHIVHKLTQVNELTTNIQTKQVEQGKSANLTSHCQTQPNPQLELAIISVDLATQHQQSKQALPTEIFSSLKSDLS